MLRNKNRTTPKRVSFRSLLSILIITTKLVLNAVKVERVTDDGFQTVEDVWRRGGTPPATLTRLAEGIAAAHGAAASVTITPGFPVTFCDPRAVALGETVSGDLFGPEAFRRLDQPIMGAEDFSYVLEKIPGAMFFLGVAEQGADWHSCPAIHSPRMTVDESALPRGAALLAGCAVHFLERGWP